MLFVHDNILHTMTTSFSNTPYLSDNHPQEIAVKALLAEKMVLLATDTVWSLTGMLHSQEAVERIQRISRNDLMPELLFASVDHLKEYVPRLHPRLETLLMVHQRPLTLLVDGFWNIPGYAYPGRTQIAVRVVQDEYLKDLIEEVDSPLFTAPAYTAEGAVAGHFGQVSSDILTQVDFVDKHRQIETNTGTLSVMATMGDKGELDFLRS
jgi:L-threonylcarbamoyladenylate synthase